ncbi:NAD-dependent succinate-semialdehyde dehydrogenase [Bifidobacterium sp. ESL0800]|uniref:NAD-dependent succinate-semialdehyde dehydrogenase n=1 Tax=Bifidobacterium sp. ESL0800 TaxID=2983236 RepID=UPI0023F6F2DB|nr:NAD-dependent succinate-semialdehyde dehydrogenase [Bifidobacterium sp. ESL0800]WEV75849.1 NAD-dependent succinate-semialdehyde dehydrogenase [Bifidobacterium sp. ESL0800]
MVYQTVNPYTNELVKEYPFATDEELQDTITLADKTFHDMLSQPIAERAKILHKVAELFREKSDELSEICTVDMGKLVGESAGEVELCAIIADWFADHSEDLLKPDKLDSIVAGDAQVLHQPVGVVVMVEPWNFPYYQIMRVFAPNFMLGNTMILKHASNTPTSAKRFCEVVEEAGAPKGALTNMFLTYDQVTKAIEDPRVQGAALTGSERGGVAVAGAAGKALKKSTMELGGMDPFIVLGDADMDALADIAWRVRLYNAGQVCTSAKRFIVMDNVYDRFVDDMVEAFSKVTPGDPMDPKTTIAPMNSKRAKEKLQNQFDEAVAAGAKIAYQFPEIDSKGQFFRPAVLTDITPDNPAYKTEMFGPVAAIYKVHSEEEAIAVANDNPYGLGGMLFCGDKDHGAEVAAKVYTGMMFVNTPLASLPDIPFGGVKLSGYGREMSRLGQMAFTNDKLLVTADHFDKTNAPGALFAAQDL